MARDEDSKNNGDEMVRLIKHLASKALKKHLEKLKRRAHNSDLEDKGEATGHCIPEIARLGALSHVSSLLFHSH